MACSIINCSECVPYGGGDIRLTRRDIEETGLFLLAASVIYSKNVFQTAITLSYVIDYHTQHNSHFPENFLSTQSWFKQNISKWYSFNLFIYKTCVTGGKNKANS